MNLKKKEAKEREAKEREAKDKEEKAKQEANKTKAGADKAAKAEDAERALPEDEKMVAYFEVTHSHSAPIRLEPSVAGEIAGGLANGKIVSGTVRAIDGCPWLCIDWPECTRLNVR